MLPEQAIKAANQSIEKLWGNKRNLGFFLVHKNQSQVAYVLIEKINQFLENNPYINISLYTSQQTQNVSVCKFGCFGAIEAKHHVGPLVCCDPVSLSSALISKRSSIYYYAYDPLFLQNNHDILKIINENKIPVILRSEEHKKFMKNYIPVEFMDSVVEDFDIKKIMEIVYE